METNTDLLQILHENNFELITKFFLDASNKNASADEKAKPYLRACKENYVYNTVLKMELRETKLKMAEMRSEKLEEITALRLENQKLKKSLQIIKQ